MAVYDIEYWDGTKAQVEAPNEKVARKKALYRHLATIRRIEVSNGSIST